MRWVYEQSTGLLTRNGAPYGRGFAGREAGRNSPAHQHVRNVGPLPCVVYRMWVVDHPRFAPPAIKLEQVEGETFGRSGFYIHGGLKSEGCIILDRPTRKGIAAFIAVRGGHELRVVAR